MCMGDAIIFFYFSLCALLMCHIQFFFFFFWAIISLPTIIQVNFNLQSNIQMRSLYVHGRCSNIFCISVTLIIAIKLSSLKT